MNIENTVVTTQSPGKRMAQRHALELSGMHRSMTLALELQLIYSVGYAPLKQLFRQPIKPDNHPKQAPYGHTEARFVYRQQAD
jgi:hypothetical protein